MDKPSILIKKKLLFVASAIAFMLGFLLFRIFYIQYFEAEFLQTRAYEQQTRDRLIKPNRGTIYDRNMVGIAVTETAYSISVIHNQIEDREMVARILSEQLELEYDYVFEKVSRRVALERIMTQVDRDIADRIRNLDIRGVVIDEDIRRVYPFSSLASQVIGFVGRDNQGIIGLEAKYDSFLEGESGKILTETDVLGRELDFSQRFRVAPVDGYNLVTTIDVILQQHAEQTLEKVLEYKNAKRGAIILMNPQTGEIYAMANKPDFDLNEPFTINDAELYSTWDTLTPEERNIHLNQMWRNFSINDTFEPGSTSKIITSIAALEEGIITVDSMFNCSGGYTVAGRLIRCWRYPRSHGSQTFLESVQNSCNPTFMIMAERMGAETFYSYMQKFGFNTRTGVDLPGEAPGIMHRFENVGPLELATMSFGQSFQITPLQLMRAASATINGGYMVTPHFARKIVDNDGNIIEEFIHDRGESIISAENSEIMRDILESVVYVGTGNRAYVAGYRIGGKTATSQKLPRGNGKYIASFLTFAPADDPQLMAFVLIDEPQGVYYGGTVAGPVMRDILENALPWLGIEPVFNEEELEELARHRVMVPDFIGLGIEEARRVARQLGVELELRGEGNVIASQFPIVGEIINRNSKVLIDLELLEESTEELEA